MNKSGLLILTAVFMCLGAFAQNSVKINFEKNKDTIQKKEGVQVYQIGVKADSLNADSLHLYSLSIKVDEEKSTLPTTDYKLDLRTTPLDKVKNGYRFYLIINGDSIADRDRSLVFSISITREGKPALTNTATTNQVMEITIRSTRTLDKYSYLAYLGTNFDLVDGIKPQNLFLATNFFLSPQKKKGFGYNFTLYGNRAMTITDTMGRSQFYSRVVGMGGDSAKYIREEGLKKVSRVSDNLGASFTPLFRMPLGMSDDKRVIRAFYAPHLEFVWRRTTVTTEFSDLTPIDSMIRHNRPITGTIYLTETSNKRNFNVYDVYLTLLGLFLCHEDESISVRFQTALGYNVRYTSGVGEVGSENSTLEKSENGYFLARTWVTEPKSGITIGAEVYNNIIRNHQPYFNVTLSKAFNIDKLAGIFSPVTAR